MHLDWRVIFTILVICVSLFFASKAFVRLYRLMMLGTKENLQGSIVDRLWLFSKNVLGQAKLFKEFGPGLQHALIFWGFLVVTIETIEMILDGLLGNFSFSFLGDSYYYLIAVQDIFHGVIILAVGYGFYRRFVVKPKRLELAKDHASDALLILTLTGLLMVANLISFAGYIVAEHGHAYPEWRPLANLIANYIYLPLGIQSKTLAMGIGNFGWALHLLTVFYFLAYIPRSKHLHVIAAGPNVFFSRLKHPGTLSKIDFSDETIEAYGVSKITDLSWKDVLDLYSCTECGRCNDYCPTATTDKPLRPRELIIDLKEQLFQTGDVLLKSSNFQDSQSLVSSDSISADTIWACTTCRACVEACPVNIEHIDKIIDMRRNQVLMEGAMPEELQVTMKNWETSSNPWGLSQDSRDDWCRDLNIPRLVDHPNAEYLFYVGCAGSFNDRNKQIATAFVKILKRARVDFAILGKEELCNGETARRAGNEYLADTMIQANIAVLKKYDVKKVLTICPHCYNTTKNEYPDFGFEAEVIHHTEFISKLVKDGKINPQLPILRDEAGRTVKATITYHDSCYLGRYNNIFQAPREILKKVPGVELLEMPRNKNEGLCCGAGGARMWMEETIGKQINVERAEEALALKPDVIASACPFCQVMLGDGVAAKQEQENTPKLKRPQILDIAEIVANSLS